MAYLHMSDEPLHVALALGIRGLVVVLDMHAGLLARHGVLLLRRKGLYRNQ